MVCPSTEGAGGKGLSFESENPWLEVSRESPCLADRQDEPNIPPTTSISLRLLRTEAQLNSHAVPVLALSVNEKEGMRVEVERAWKEEEDALALLPKVDAVLTSYSEVDAFLLAVETFCTRYNCVSEQLAVADFRMKEEVAYFYSRRMKAVYPEREKCYETLAKLMSQLVCFRDPETILHTCLEGVKPNGSALELYIQVGSAYDVYVRLCERLETEVKLTEDSLASKFISLLPAEVRDKTDSIYASQGRPGILRCVEIAVEARASIPAVTTNSSVPQTQPQVFRKY